MKRHYNAEAIREDLNTAIEAALERHGLNIYSLLGVCCVVETMASPFKLQRLQGIIGRRMGLLGQEAYEASRLAQAVALLQAPDSKVVNPLMECIGFALLNAKKALSDEELERDTLRIYLRRPRLTLAGVPKARTLDASFVPAFDSAKSYLLEGGIIRREGSNCLLCTV